MEDLYVEDDGYVWSHALDEEHERLGREEYSCRYNDLERQLIRWCDTCCKHKRMHVCDEWVCNSSGWSELQWLFQQLGNLTPTLADMLPNGNGGSFPAELAEFASAHFRVTLVEGKLDPCRNENRGEIAFLEDSDGTESPLKMGWWDFRQIDPRFRGAPVEYRVVEDGDEKWAHWKIEVIQKLLAASLETGNPIQWC